MNRDMKRFYCFRALPHSAQWHVIQRSAPFRQYRRSIYDPSGLEWRGVNLLVIVLLIVSREVVYAVFHQSGKNKDTKSKTVSPLNSGECTARGKQGERSGAP